MTIMGGKFLHAIAYLFLLCMGRTTGSGLRGTANSEVRCIESEKKALLRFKQGFQNTSSGLFSSWVAEEEEDCCRWKGVGCNDSTPGHVISLNLSGNGQRGELSYSLLDLPYLSSLDLSQNNFLQAPIPDFIGSLSHLKHLNLSNSNFRGRIPDHLGNLSRLHSLDLNIESFSVLRANDLKWLRGLFSLEFLDLGGVDLSSCSVDWLDSINMLPSLVELHLSACGLQKLHHPSLPYTVNFTSLEILDLSLNNFNSSIPPWLFNISRSLVSMNLRRSQLQGLIPNAFGNLTSLAVLDLSENKLSGSLDQILPQLSRLVVLNVAKNLLEGTITEDHLLNFNRLRVLDLSSNFLKFNISSTWIPPFRLHAIGLQQCQLGPQFPEWLRFQKYLFYLDIAEAGVSDIVPHWFWNLSDKVQHLNLSHNQLRGKLPIDFSSKANLLTLDLSGNNFDGPLPRFSPSLVSLSLTSNSFFGPISSVCEILVLNNTIRRLKLSSNAFSGVIPDCWAYGEKLVILKLDNNNLSGKIPNSIGRLVNLSVLTLYNNSLSGVVPPSLKNCRRLVFLNFRHNKLSGNIPEWIGVEVQNLRVLILSYNAFGGDIPAQLCRLKSVRYLNLSHNNLSGTIPHCLDNLLALRNPEDVPYYVYEPYNFDRDAPIRVGGYSIGKLDLSSNKLSGEIPRKITSLTGLVFLNLSNNRLIPEGIIGDIENLWYLDLSRNGLSCIIPPSLSNLSFLRHLKLSYNGLSGKIPILNQSEFIDGIDGSCFMENHMLCGYQLANNCSFNKNYEDPDCRELEKNEENHVGCEEEDDEGDDVLFFSDTCILLQYGAWVRCWILGFLGQFTG